MPLTSNPARRVDLPGWAGPSAIALAAMAAYGRTLSVPLLFDDIGTIAHNASIRHWASAFFPPYSTTAGGRPILNFSLAINYAISGPALWSYHATNLAIHILAGLGLFGILRRTRLGVSNQFALPAALLWTLHPLQTESVTYLSQRAESLMGLFYLLTLYCFIRFAEADEMPASGRSGTRRRFRACWAAGSIACCLLGMATKEVMVSAPIIVLLYDRTFLAGGFREAWRRRRSFYCALAATWLILPFLVHSTHGRGGTSGFGVGVSWWSYALTQFPAILRYLKLSFWPRPLVFDYGTEWVRDYWTVVPGAAVVIGLVAATVFSLFRPASRNSGGRALGLAGTFFFAILAPSSLVPGNRQTAAEHRMYLALIPLVVLVVVGIYRSLGRGALASCLALAVVLSGITWLRNENYRTALELWTVTVAQKPDNPYARNNLGGELEKVRGRNREAIDELEMSLRLKPDSPEAHNNLGNALAKIPGRLPDAIAQYEEAVRLNPRLAEAQSDLGYALEKMPGRLVEAIAHHEAAVSLNPDSAEMRYSLGYALEKSPGRLDDAIVQYEAALRLNPDFAAAHYKLGNALISAGRAGEAMAQYEAALRLDPRMAEAHVNWANLLKAAGRTEQAMAEYKEALRLQPDDAEAHYNLGNALYGAGRTADAIVQYEAALRLDPENADYHYNLAITLLQTPGRAGEAAGLLEATLRLQPGNDSARQILDQMRNSPR